MMKVGAEQRLCPLCGRPKSGEICLHCAGRDLENSTFPQKSEVVFTPPELEGWLVGRLLSVGGMSEVWLAEREEGEPKQGVIKVLATGRSGDVELSRRFEMEAELLATFEHENIVTLLDVETCRDGRLALILEYVEGSDLSRLLKAGRIGAERALEIFEKVAGAVIYCHEQGVVHRDLKPGNILVSKDGVVKLTDFGLAKDVSGNQRDLKTQREGGLGTAYYLAPEALKAAGEVDQRADVYSLGVLLYELLAGKPPMGTYTPVSEESGLARRWDVLIRMALQEDRGKRHQSVRALKEEVSGLWQAHQRKIRGKARWKGTLGIAALVLSCGLGIWLGRESSRPKDQEPPELDFRLPGSASKDDPWVNGFGMKFLPLEGEAPTVLMAETETPLKVYLEFFREEASLVPDWRSGDENRPRNILVLTSEGWIRGANEPGIQPGYEAGVDSPAFGVSAIEARFFCRWLTIQERARGRISEHDYYRLPTYEEWIEAATDEVSDDANFAGREVEGGDWPFGRSFSEEEDDFVYMAPVRSGVANEHGFFHLYGNVNEWVLMEEDEEGRRRLGRTGGSWASHPALVGQGPAPASGRMAGRRTDNGFRCVLVLGE